jgi:hypothetical protein
MKKTLLLSTLLVFIIACVPQQADETAAPSQPSQKEETKEEVPVVQVTVLRCEDTDGGNYPETKGAAVLYYSDNSKESKDDHCVKNELDFPFQEEFICEGTAAVGKVNRCPNACERGVCS